MRLGWLGRMVAKWKTGYWPPYASARIEFSFDLGDPFHSHVAFHGSTVPSQRQYVNWRKVADYRMDYDLTEGAYAGFIRSDGTDAPSYKHTTLYRGLMVQPISSEDVNGRGMASEEDSGGGLR